MRVRYYVFLSDESLLTWLYENGKRPIKVSAMFQMIYMCTEFTQPLVLDGKTSILVWDGIGIGQVHYTSNNSVVCILLTL